MILRSEESSFAIKDGSPALSDYQMKMTACCALLGTEDPPLADEAYIQCLARQPRAKSRQIRFLQSFLRV